ncbi:MAG: hypothetical protein HGA80_06755 [Candidatus Omnitrophica bacterium]|nr:hypothetical protein [Candidatus Omnitrophota bacterium]
MRMMTGWLLVLCLGLAAAPAWAGSGAYSIDVPDAAAVGKGDAFVGEANTPAALFYNPAGMTQLKESALSADLSVIQPKVSYSPESGDKIQMKQESFYIPAMSYVTNLGTERVALGVGATSHWGLTTEWGQNVGLLRYSATRTEMTDKDYLIAGAYKLTDALSLGLGVEIDRSNVDKQKKIYQQNSGDANFRLKGDSTGANVNVSALYKLNERHQFGLIYRGATEHKYRGKVHLDHMSTAAQASLGGFSYQQVFGGASYETAVIAKSTLPQSAVVGYSFRPDNKWVFNADVEWMDWGAIKKEELAYPDETDPNRLGVLNNGNPVNRDWHDAWSCNLGAQYSLTERLRLRGGYFFHQTPIPATTQDMGLPDSNSHSVTTGVGYDLTKSLTLDLSWSAMFFKTRTINSEVNDTYGGIDGTYHEWINLMLVTATYRF